jgi:hypothetical protein
LIQRRKQRNKQNNKNNNNNIFFNKNLSCYCEFRYVNYKYLERIIIIMTIIQFNNSIILTITAYYEKRLRRTFLAPRDEKLKVMLRTKPNSLTQ